MKPILFNTEMVKAILDGRKTVTRRINKDCNDYTVPLMDHVDVDKRTYAVNSFYDREHKQSASIAERRMPICKGDLLYVRETWYKDDNCILYKAGGYENTIGYRDINGHDISIRWRPSIHMPKEAARIFLRVKDVRVERLQDMDHDAPAKEGIRGYTKDGEIYKFAVSDDWWLEYHRTHKKEFRGTYWQDMPKNPTIAFSYLWNSTIPKKDPEDMYKYGWKANPWVWVIEFERTDCNGESFKISG